MIEISSLYDTHDTTQIKYAMQLLTVIGNMIKCSVQQASQLQPSKDGPTHSVAGQELLIAARSVRSFYCARSAWSGLALIISIYLLQNRVSTQ